MEDQRGVIWSAWELRRCGDLESHLWDIESVGCSQSSSSACDVAVEGSQSVALHTMARQTSSASVLHQPLMLRVIAFRLNLCNNGCDTVVERRRPHSIVWKGGNAAVCVRQVKGSWAGLRDLLIVGGVIVRAHLTP